ncbi:MAG TPA: ChaN family lipoprotein [Williamwhitmania sp.]|nr:ChaN family lipoprotein [Williamwhitmania sp.]
MKKIVFAFVFAISFLTIKAQDVVAYRIFTSDGVEVPFSKVMEAAYNSDVLFFGEQHNNPVVHWLELQAEMALQQHFSDSLVLGAEMFEADNQLMLDELFQGLIPLKKFEEECRLWPNYKTDYKPLLELALEKKLRFVATNIPRRYASAVATSGIDVLAKFSREAHLYMAPLPIKFNADLPSYKAMAAMGMAGGAHGASHIAEAQAVKDATMAYFIVKNLPVKGCFLHFNGSYHSDDHEGIPYMVKQLRPSLKVLTISSVEQDKVDSLAAENKGKGDFVVVVNGTMTKTY